MGLRQSKRLDITGSPKKEAPAAVVEKVPESNDAGMVSKNEEDGKIANGETKTESAEVAPQEDIKDISLNTTEAVNESKATEESPIVLKDEKKEKVKKKRSFRSFSFLRREKKTKEENNKNGDVSKESKAENVEQIVDAAPTTEAESSTLNEQTETAAPIVEQVADEPLASSPAKEDGSVLEEKPETAPLAAAEEVAPPVVEPVQEDIVAPAPQEAVAEAASESKDTTVVLSDIEKTSSEPAVSAESETTQPAVEQDSAETEITCPTAIVETVQENEKKVEVVLDESQTVGTSEE